MSILNHSEILHSVMHESEERHVKGDILVDVLDSLNTLGHCLILSCLLVGQFIADIDFPNVLLRDDMGIGLS